MCLRLATRRRPPCLLFFKFQVTLLPERVQPKSMKFHCFTDYNVLFESSKPATLSAGMGAFAALTVVIVLVVLGAVVCVIRYKRKGRSRGIHDAEVKQQIPSFFFMIASVTGELMVERRIYQRS